MSLAYISYWTVLFSQVFGRYMFVHDDNFVIRVAKFNFSLQFSLDVTKIGVFLDELYSKKKLANFFLIKNCL